MKRSIKFLLSFLSFFAVLGFSSFAFAQGAEGEAIKTQGMASNYGLIALAAGLSIGLAALGGGIGQGRASASALDGIARNPGAKGQIFTPMILGLALIESLVIYALLISLLLFSKLG